MSIEGTRRLALVRDLLEMTMPLGNVIRDLSTMAWDYDGEGVELTTEHLANALQRYLRGDVSESDIELWANQVEGRDDVQFQESAESVIKEVLHELANPLLTQLLDHPRAIQLVRNLTRSG